MYNFISFLRAVCYGNLDIVKYLLQNGADIHANDDAALKAAINNNKQNVVDFLTNYHPITRIKSARK